MNRSLRPVAVWLPSSSWRGSEDDVVRAIPELEALGYGAVWLGGADAALGLPRALLRASDRMVVATGIVNIWTCGSATVAARCHQLLARYPGRFFLGIGSGHRVRLEQAGLPYRPVLPGLNSYLDRLDEAGIPTACRLVAALGPRLLALAAQRSAGAHPFLVTPAHTALARSVIGAAALLIPEQAVVLEENASKARQIARNGIAHLLELANYRNSLLRQGFTLEQIEHGGSDQLIDGLVAWGNLEQISQRVTAHLEAGADQVALHVIAERPGPPVAEWRALGALIALTSRNED